MGVALQATPAPCAQCILAVKRSFYGVDLSDGTCLVHFLGFFIGYAAYTLAAYLENFAALFLCCDNSRTFFYRMNYRFFAVHVFACFERVYSYLLVPMVGCSDDYCVHIFPGQYFLIAARCENVVTPFGFCIRKPAIVQVAHSNELSAWHCQCNCSVLGAHNTCTNQGEVDIVVSCIARS